MTRLPEAGDSRCSGCPIIIHGQNALDALETDRQAAIELFMGEESEESLLAIFSVARKIVANEGIEMPTEGEILRSYRRDVGSTEITEIDERRDQVSQDMKRLRTGCLGPVKMKASVDGRLYSVTVCGSPQFDEGEHCCDAHLRIDKQAN